MTGKVIPFRRPPAPPDSEADLVFVIPLEQALDEALDGVPAELEGEPRCRMCGQHVDGLDLPVGVASLGQLCGDCAPL